MRSGLFVTGTDTDSGKTLVATGLVRALRRRGLRVAGFKPVAAGAVLADGKLCNDDALALREASGLDLPYAFFNPYCFAPPIAPHLAAAQAGIEIDPATILAACDRLGEQAELVVVEGAGGWRVPLGRDFDIQGLALQLGLPVLLVVGLRLGCLNHALLSEQAMRDSGVPLLGWVGSVIDPAMPALDGNLATLRDVLTLPHLGILPHRPGPSAFDTLADAVLAKLPTPVA